MSHANRGRAWQRKLARIHTGYRRDRRASVHETQPAVKVLGRVGSDGTFRACFGGEGPPDFSGIAARVSVLFDAKDCTSRKSWPLDDLPEHQAKDLEAHMVNGGRSFVVLRIKQAGLSWFLPWETLGPFYWRWFDGGGRPASVNVETADRLGVRINDGDWLPALEAMREAA